MMYRRLVPTFTLATAFLLALAGPLPAQDFSAAIRSLCPLEEQAKHVPSDPVENHFFGHAVAVDGDVAVVGAIYDDDNGNNAGSAYVFRRNGLEWSEEAELFSAGSGYLTLFGSSVAVDGDTVVVGAPTHLCQWNGAAYVFVWDGATWQQQAMFTGPYCFGDSVTIQGDTLVVGSPRDVSGAGTGAAHVYARHGSTWELETTLYPSENGHAFGSAVSLDGSLLAVGDEADFSPSGGGNSGSAYVFARTGTLWSEEAKLVAADADCCEYFGSTLSLDGETLLVGAPGDNKKGVYAGAAYVFTREPGGWAQEELSPASHALGDRLGRSVSLSGDVALLGAWGDDDHGAAYTYVRSGTSWSEEARLEPSDGELYPQYRTFGWAVAIDGDCAWIGDPEHATDIFRAGGAYAFARTCHASPGELTRTSVDSQGGQGNASSNVTRVSGDGRFVVFVSDASSLVPDDTNGVADVFVHDLATGAVERVSVGSDGSQADGASGWPDISHEGRFVVFSSHASNLVPGDSNGSKDIYRHDRSSGQTVRVSVATDGSEADSKCLRPAISADGNIVLFESASSALVAGDFNGASDVFARDVDGGVTVRVSVGSAGQEGDLGSSKARPSADGRFVVFESAATTLVPGDTNGFDDIFVRDLQTGQTELVSVAPDGTQGDGDSFHPTLSADGRLVCFSSKAQNLVPGDSGKTDAFVRDRVAGLTRRVSVAATGQAANKGSNGPRISADGNWVVFHTAASNLVPGDTNGGIDVFLKHLTTGQVTLVSVASFQGNALSSYAALSAAAETVVFQSDASNLVSDDTNGVRDVFAVELGP